MIFIFDPFSSLFTFKKLKVLLEHFYVQKAQMKDQSSGLSTYCSKSSVESLKLCSIIFLVQKTWQKFKAFSRHFKNTRSSVSPFFMFKKLKAIFHNINVLKAQRKSWSSILLYSLSKNSAFNPDFNSKILEKNIQKYSLETTSEIFIYSLLIWALPDAECFWFKSFSTYIILYIYKFTLIITLS